MFFPPQSPCATTTRTAASPHRTSHHVARRQPTPGSLIDARSIAKRRGRGHIYTCSEPTASSHRNRARTRWVKRTLFNLKLPQFLSTSSPCLLATAHVRLSPPQEFLRLKKISTIPDTQHSQNVPSTPTTPTGSTTPSSPGNPLRLKKIPTIPTAITPLPQTLSSTSSAPHPPPITAGKNSPR